MRAPCRAAAAALLLLLAAAAARAGPGPLNARTRDFDQLHLLLSVEPDLERRTLEGRAELTFAAVAGGLKRLRLHSEDTVVLSVTDSEGRSLAHRFEGGILAIDLAEALAKGRRETVTIHYRSKPTSGLWFSGPTKEHPDTPLAVYSQGEGTENRHWIPCYDEPDDRLLVEVHVTVKDPLKTASNGLLVKDVYSPGPKRTDFWKLSRPIPTYLITLVVGMYDYWVDEGRPIVDYRTLGGRIEEAKYTLRNTRAMIRCFEKLTGVPYPYERYGQVFVWDFLYGGMENASMTTLNMRALHGPEVEPNYTADSLVAHELAHMWFGDLLTCRTWDHIWLNEGFATYFADLWIEKSEGRDAFRVRRWRQTSGYVRGNAHPEKLGLTRTPRGDLPVELFGGKQYDRGAAILHQLRLELGDRAFFAAIRDYTKNHQDSAVVTNDFRRAAERQAGRDLSWFFDQWVYGVGYPRLAVSWRYDEGPGATVVTVRQTQPEEGGQGLFRLTLPIAVHLEKAVVRGNRVVQRREHEFSFPCPAAPLFVRVDDGTTLLARVEVEQPFAAWRAQALTDDDVVGRIVALGELGRFGPRGCAVIAEALGTDPFHAVRSEAARALGGFPENGTAGETLRAALDDEDSRVREAVCEAMGGRRGETDGRALLDRLPLEKHPFVRAALARSLGRLHLPGAYDLLAGLLKEESHREIVRQGALQGLAALGDRRAVALAYAYLDYRWGRGAMSAMRHAALDLILALDPDGRESRAKVAALLADPYFRMRQWAARACGSYGIREAIPVLRKLAAGDRHGGVRRAAKKALADLTKREE